MSITLRHSYKQDVHGHWIVCFKPPPTCTDINSIENGLYTWHAHLMFRCNSSCFGKKVVQMSMGCNLVQPVSVRCLVWNIILYSRMLLDLTPALWISLLLYRSHSCFMDLTPAFGSHSCFMDLTPALWISLLLYISEQACDQ
jgi:hypothetical protein